jgi:hypothetical protein
MPLGAIGWWPKEMRGPTGSGDQTEAQAMMEYPKSSVIYRVGKKM